jgi:hypothetical protein
MPPLHISYILQLLDVSYFGALKTAYSRLITDLVRRSIFYINKADFLLIYCQAYRSIFLESTIKNSFKATGLVPFNPETILLELIATPPLASHTQDQGSSLI